MDLRTIGQDQIPSCMQINHSKGLCWKTPRNRNAGAMTHRYQTKKICQGNPTSQLPLPTRTFPRISEAACRDQKPSMLSTGIPQLNDMFAQAGSKDLQKRLQKKLLQHLIELLALTDLSATWVMTSVMRTVGGIVCLLCRCNHNL